jgi:tight adherence protein C
MSELYLFVGLAGVFGAIVIGFTVLGGGGSERHRALRVLEAQIRPVVSSNLREQELSRPFTERLVPMVAALGRMARRITPLDMRKRIAKKLVMAGNPKGWDADKVAAFKVLAGALAAIFVVAITKMVGLSTTVTIGAGLVLFFMGFIVPDAMVGQAATQRQEAMRRALADSMDLLTISVEAGLGFDAALAHVIKNVPGPLSQEFGRTLQEMQLGVSRVDALRHLADRSDVDELNGFVLAMIQADVFGISVAKVLRAQSKELRMKRRQRAEEKAMKTPSKLMFPLIFMILPSMFVVILGPGMIKLLHQVLGGNF